MIPPRVSVIIPTFRHGAIVLETLESVFAQSFTDYEVIVVNDGSPDDTAERLHPLAEAGRIRYFEQTNQGQAGARNRGLAEARGEFVAYLDDDDLWPPDKLEWQVRWLEERGGDVVVGNVAYFGGSGFVPDWPEMGEVLDHRSFFIGNGIVSPGQALVRRETFQRVGPWNERYRGSDDLDLWFRLAKVTPLWVVNRVALRYRLHADNASKNVVSMATNVWAVMKAHLAELPNEQRDLYFPHAVCFLQAFVGGRLVTTCLAALRHGRFILAGQAVRAMSPILVNLLRNRRLLKRFLYDCAPRFGYTVAKRFGISR